MQLLLIVAVIVLLFLTQRDVFWPVITAASAAGFIAYLVANVMKLLEKKPEHRPRDAAMVAQVQGIWRDVDTLEADMRALMGVPLAAAPAKIALLLKEMQKTLFDKAKTFRDANTYEVNSWVDFKKQIEEPGGFLMAHWDGTRETEDRIAAETKATPLSFPPAA